MPKSKSDYETKLAALTSKLNSSVPPKTRKSPAKKDVASTDLCVASVTSTKGKAKAILKGDDKRTVYMMSENDNKKHTFYLRCSRAHKDGSKFCGIHKKTYDDDKTKIVNHKRMIAQKNVTDVVIEDDIFADKVAKKTTNPKKKKTIVAGDVDVRLEKLEAMMLGLVKAVSDAGSIKSNTSVAESVTESVAESVAEESLDSDNESGDSGTDSKATAEAESESDNDAESESDNDAESEDEAKATPDAKSDAESDDDGADDSGSDDDKEVDAIPITTNDGQDFFLVEDTMAIYDSESTEIGKFMEVNDDDSCVCFKDTQYIIADDLTYKGDTYFRCVVSNKAYQANGSGEINHVGKVVKTTSGKYKVKPK